MAATEPDASPRPAPTEGHDTPPGDEPLAVDLPAPAPRPTNRALVAVALVLAVLLLVSAVVGFVLLHQPRLTPVPVPSVSSIA